jgi:hypothetical protein
MKFRFDPYERRFRLQTLVPTGQEARAFTADELFQFGIEEEYFLSHPFQQQPPEQAWSAQPTKRLQEKAASRHESRPAAVPSHQPALRAHLDPPCRACFKRARGPVASWVVQSSVWVNQTVDKCVFLNKSKGREFVDFWPAADHSHNNQRTLKTIYLGNRCSIRLSYGTKRKISILGTF